MASQHASEQASDKPASLTAPEPASASRFALTVSAQDFMLAVGRVRVGYDVHGHAAQSRVEYPAAYSLSPIAAKQLAAMLTHGVTQYEQNFGPIPEDADVMKRLAAGGHEAIVEDGRVVPVKAPARKKTAAKKR